MTHCVLIYVSQDVQSAAENSAEFPSCAQSADREALTVSFSRPFIFDLVYVALEMVGV